MADRLLQYQGKAEPVSQAGESPHVEAWQPTWPQPDRRTRLRTDCFSRVVEPSLHVVPAYPWDSPQPAPALRVRFVPDWPARAVEPPAAPGEEVTPDKWYAPAAAPLFRRAGAASPGGVVWVPGAGEGSVPVADFVGTPLAGPAALAVQFTDLSSGNPTAWSWQFGDLTFSTEQHPLKVYTFPGTYTVRLRAINALGLSPLEVKIGYVSVGPATYPDWAWPPDVPVRRRSGPASPYAGVLSLDASVVTPPDPRVNAPLKYYPPSDPAARWDVPADPAPRWAAPADPALRWDS